MNDTPAVTLLKPEEELQIINQKRSALQRLVKLTAMLSRLHQGLQSVLLMGNPTSYIPEKVIEHFKSLTDRLTNQPTEKIQNTLNSADLKINRDIKRILDIAQASEDELARKLGTTAGTSLEKNFHDYAADFKKNAQTSIALRITLKSRNVPVKPFTLPVPDNVISQQMTELDKKEHEYRGRVEDSMETIQKDITRLIKRADFPEDMKRRLDEVRENLRKNIDYFSEGRPIEDMPILQETIDQPDFNQPGTEAIQQDEQQETVAEEAATAGKQEKPEKRGFINRTREWLTTPWSTGWKDIDKYKK